MDEGTRRRKTSIRPLSCTTRAGIARITNVEGNVNVDFEDVKIMGEQGQAMMGTASVSGADRARVAAEHAIASPAAEGVT